VRGNLDNQTNLYVACVLDPGQGFMGIYTNGVLAVSTNTLRSLEDVSTNRFYLGRSLFPTDPPLKGSIDEFRVYRAALSPKQISENFKNGPDVVPK